MWIVYEFGVDGGCEKYVVEVGLFVIVSVVGKVQIIVIVVK